MQCPLEEMLPMPGRRREPGCARGAGAGLGDAGKAAGLQRGGSSGRAAPQLWQEGVQSSTASAPVIPNPFGKFYLC